MNRKKYSSTLAIKNMERIILMILADVFIIIASALICEVLQNNTINIPVWDFYKGKYREILILCASTVAVLSAFRSYITSWRYADYVEFAVMYVGISLSSAITYVLSRVIVLDEKLFKFSDYATMAIICIFGFTIERYLGRLLRIHGIKIVKGEKKNRTRVMVIGAGDTGSALIKGMRRDLGMNPVVVIDDDVNKHGMFISEVPIVGGRDRIPSAAKDYKVEEIIIAIPSGKKNDYNSIITICRSTGKKVSTVPSLFELASGKARVNEIRSVTPQDLLGRDEQIIDGKDVFGYIEEKTVLVTGGGGSIGSELCRQIATFNPKRLIIFDIYENNAYDLQMELRRKYPELRFDVLIGSVRDIGRLEEVFSAYKPNVVFHAAAHKHVPLMEDSPNEAIKNNIYGTYNVCLTSEKFGVGRVVLISTDKAVNPTNIMGTSKRVAEMVVQQFALRQRENDGKTIYAAVRFGNVLGSNGSVIPLFKKQIKEGGPITVTHPEINRFFMTIPEAAQLVMQAGAFAEGGEIFILDMGEPVKIVDLARNLIELSGYVPDVDIKIEFTGLRPGEKLYEELLLDRQKHSATKHNKIFIEKPIEDSRSLVTEIYALRERLSCDIPLYNNMVEWFEKEFVK